MSVEGPELATCIGDALRHRRDHQWMWQWEVADKAGITQPRYSLIERGYHLPTLTTLRTVTGALGWTLADLFTYLEQENQ